MLITSSKILQSDSVTDHKIVSSWGLPAPSPHLCFDSTMFLSSVLFPPPPNGHALEVEGGTTLWLWLRHAGAAEGVQLLQLGVGWGCETAAEKLEDVEWQARDQSDHHHLPEKVLGFDEIPICRRTGWETIMDYTSYK